jgi:DNA-binding NarL/FixJ family response regulator
LQTLSQGADNLRVAIRSDRRLLRDALAARLRDEPGFTVVGHVADDRDLRQLCTLRSPHVVLYDPSACVATSLRELRTLRSAHDHTRFVMVYEQMSSADLATAWHVGIDNLIPYSRGLDALLVVLHEYAGALRAGAAPRPPAGGLTDQEREIIALISSGYNTSRIAELVGISPLAVDSRKRRIYQKLGVAGRGQAVARATALGLVGRAPAVRPRTAQRDGTVLAVIRGTDTPARQRTVTALLGFGVPFVIENPGQPTDLAGWQQSNPGPVLPVLVDPTPDCWAGLDTDTAPVLLVRSGPVPRAEALELIGRRVAGIVAAELIDDVLIPALHLVAAGGLALDPASATAVVSAVRVGPGEVEGPRPRPPELTAREREILGSIASGDTVRQTARALGIAPKTVENIQARLFRKLGARNRAGAVATAHTLGLVDLVDPARPARRPTTTPD